MVSSNNNPYTAIQSGDPYADDQFDSIGSKSVLDRESNKPVTA